MEIYIGEGGHGFSNKSPWLERTTERADQFLQTLGSLGPEPNQLTPSGKLVAWQTKMAVSINHTSIVIANLCEPGTSSALNASVESIHETLHPEPLRAVAVGPLCDGR
jgi:hypothetical protein